MHIKALILSAILLLPLPSQAITALFYQPQAADQSIPIEKWGSIFSRIHKNGFDALVVQWSQYGDFLEQEKDINWLKQVLIQAKTSNLKIIMGLRSDPEAFSKLAQAPAGLEIYFQKTLEGDKRALSRWSQPALIDSIIGWYIPLEIDDREWRDIDRRAILQSFLDREASQIQKISPKPVYLSSFFTGNMTPDNYAQLLTELKGSSNIKIWVQDGGGTNKLTSSERSLYFKDINNCKVGTVDGVIYEIFKQTQHDQSFTAEALSKSALAQKIKLRAPCKRDSIFFELRYLINLQDYEK